MARLTRNEAYALAGLGAVALILAAAGSKMAPGASIKTPARATEDITTFAVPPDRPVLGPHQHLGGYVFTPHRYPPACGSEISALIHHGLTPAALPAEGDMLWLSAPPSEGEL
jgi:hypothetical protein